MRILRRIAKWTGLGLLVLLALGAAWQQIAALSDDGLLSRGGSAIMVDGHRVNLVCAGSGKRTLVLDAGLGASSFEWFRLQPALARHARVCAFDRPGLGASEATAHAYDGITAADELHALTRAAALPRPFVYVGHSLGANFAQIYAARYPADVAALVLIEPGVPKDLLEDFHGTRREALALPATCAAACQAAWVAGALAVPRLAVYASGAGGKTLADSPLALAQYRAATARTSAAGVSLAYLDALPRIAWQVLDARLPSALPVLILASQIDPPPDADETAADMAKWRKAQLAYFATLTARSRDGTGPVIIAGASHSAMVMGPGAAQSERAITAFLGRLP